MCWVTKFKWSHLGISRSGQLIRTTFWVDWPRFKSKRWSITWRFPITRQEILFLKRDLLVFRSSLSSLKVSSKWYYKAIWFDDIESSKGEHVIARKCEVYGSEFLQEGRKSQTYKRASLVYWLSLSDLMIIYSWKVTEYLLNLTLSSSINESEEPSKKLSRRMKDHMRWEEFFEIQAHILIEKNDESSHWTEETCKWNTIRSTYLLQETWLWTIRVCLSCETQ